MRRGRAADGRGAAAPDLCRRRRAWCQFDARCMVAPHRLRSECRKAGYTADADYAIERDQLSAVGSAMVLFTCGFGELVTRSDAFRARWAAHNVRYHRSGFKRIHHPAVGDLEFEFEGMELPGTDDWILYAYTLRAGSPTEERVALLGSLAATRRSAKAGVPNRATS